MYLLHEWAADHFPFVQYPRIRRVLPKRAPLLQRVAIWEIRAAWSIVKAAIGFAIVALALAALVFAFGMITGLFAG
ncbi:hypothetical protein [Paraburkholderia phosphatilytica]|uniref:hypothetical protein n=1 Tax=Paraburkholderia phosphatilytica TaxID=2282883 RepID=UPI000F5F0DC1|nr:hypothetical protein [Paraburkholderia phosphatilytica]